MKVYFVQHGEAEDEKKDLLRPLSEKGRFETGRIAGLLAVSGMVKINRVYHSGKLRAKQTAEIFAGALGAADMVHEVKGLMPMDNPSDCIKMIEAETEDIMIAGHLPHLAKTVSKLLCGDENKKIAVFYYSGVICVEKQQDNSWAVVPVFCRPA